MLHALMTMSATSKPWYCDDMQQPMAAVISLKYCVAINVCMTTEKEVRILLLQPLAATLSRSL